MLNAKAAKVAAPPPQTVPYSKLYTFANTSDRLLMAIGIVSSTIMGFGMPSFVFLIGEILDSFGAAAVDPDKSLRTISKMSLIFACVGAGIWIFSYISYYAFIMFSESVTKKTRTKYLQAILKQDSAWFDTNNASELSAKLNKETQAI